MSEPYRSEYEQALRYGAEHFDELGDLLGSLTDHDRWGTGDHVKRGVVADKLSEHGREDEAELLRSPQQHVILDGGLVRKGRFTKEPLIDAYNEARESLHRLPGYIAPYYLMAGNQPTPEGRWAVGFFGVPAVNPHEGHLSDIRTVLGDILTRLVPTREAGNPAWDDVDRHLELLRTAPFEEVDPR